MSNNWLQLTIAAKSANQQTCSVAKNCLQIVSLNVTQYNTRATSYTTQLYTF